MEVRDGFIVGIFNYCDGWCERCSLTSYCRLFADQAAIEASLDPHLAAVTAAPPLPEEMPPPPPAWLQELNEQAERAAAAVPPPVSEQRTSRTLPPAHRAIGARADEYAARTYAWLSSCERESDDPGADARALIGWFHRLIAVKIHRALDVWPDQPPEDPTGPSDRDGSTKVALLAMDRSRTAWRELATQGRVPAAEADRFITDLVWLGEALERVRSKARAFVRPAFDEPEAVAELVAMEGWRR